MVDNIVTKPLGLVLIVTAHMVFNGHSQKVTGILGSSIALEFILNVTIMNNSHFAVYKGQNKIAECRPGEHFSRQERLNVYRGNVSVFCHISNLKLDDNGSYWATLFMGLGLPKKSNEVELIVLEDNSSSSTGSPMPTNSTIPEHRGSSSLFAFYIVTVLVVLSVVLLVAVLSWLIWCLVRTKDKQQQQQQQQQQQSSYPTVQETVEPYNNVPAPSVVYSVLDFPKRPPAVLEMNPNDTEYAAVSYLPEQKRV